MSKFQENTENVLATLPDFAARCNRYFKSITDIITGENTIFYFSYFLPMNSPQDFFPFFVDIDGLKVRNLPTAHPMYKSISLVTLSDKKWHWRARVSPIQLFDLIPKDINFTHLLTSSVMPLAELLGLCPRLAKCKKTIYFHENQLVYPIQEVKSRDVQYGYNQITACLAADTILFNSNWNKKSFLENIPKFLKIIPDYRPKNIVERISEKSTIVYFPVSVPELNDVSVNQSKVPHIVWPGIFELAIATVFVQK
jgi:hypothetical protein